jgi:lipoic acid synthetase
MPPALRRSLGRGDDVHGVQKLLRQHGLHTVCEEARCPNRGECFGHGTATFLIGGDTCTRRCGFCNVRTGKPAPLPAAEPEQVAHAAQSLGLKHVVITSVDRDDLPDGGAGHWAACIRAVRAALPQATVEVLTPDFKGQPELVDVVLAAGPHVFNHNVETVPRLYHALRPQSRMETSLSVLRHARGYGGRLKSGLMVGLGESDDEVLETLAILADVGVDIATVGQYLRPTLQHWAVQRYVDDVTFGLFRAHGERLGIPHVFSGPLVRSSFHAAEAFRAAGGSVPPP